MSKKGTIFGQGHDFRFLKNFLHEWTDENFQHFSHKILNIASDLVGIWFINERTQVVYKTQGIRSNSRVLIQIHTANFTALTEHKCDSTLTWIEECFKVWWKLFHNHSDIFILIFS